MTDCSLYWVVASTASSRPMLFIPNLQATSYHRGFYSCLKLLTISLRYGGGWKVLTFSSECDLFLNCAQPYGLEHFICDEFGCFYWMLCPVFEQKQYDDRCCTKPTRLYRVQTFRTLWPTLVHTHNYWLLICCMCMYEWPSMNYCSSHEYMALDNSEEGSFV